MIVTATNNSVTELKGLHLYHADMSNCSMRVRMVLKEKNLPWTSHHLDLRKKEAVTPEYFGIHPKGLVPALVHDGVVHIESNDIIEYLDDTFRTRRYSRMRRKSATKCATGCAQRPKFTCRRSRP